MEKINLNESIVTIKEVMVGNKRMTKSFFNQIEIAECFDQNLDFRGDLFYGYVKESDGKYLLWAINGKLRKTNLSPYLWLKGKAEYATLVESKWFLKMYKFESIDRDSDYYDPNGKLSTQITDPNRYEQLVAKVQTFIGEVREHQIFL